MDTGISDVATGPGTPGWQGPHCPRVLAGKAAALDFGLLAAGTPRSSISGDSRDVTARRLHSRGPQELSLNASVHCERGLH